MSIEPFDSQGGVPSRHILIDRDDPFGETLAKIWEMHERKGADYAADSDQFSNFRDTSDLMALDRFSAVESAWFNILQKVVRIKSLRRNGRLDDPANEAVTDTYLDLAVYAVICYTLSQE